MAVSSLQGEQQLSLLSQIGHQACIGPEPSGAGGRGQSGSGYIAGGRDGGEGLSGGATSGLDDTIMHHQGGNEGFSEEKMHAADNSKRARSSPSRLNRQRRVSDNTVGKLTPCPTDPTASAVLGGGCNEQPMIRACESDIWAWALIVLQMFSDEPWPPGSGQVGYHSVVVSRRFVDRVVFPSTR